MYSLSTWLLLANYDFYITQTNVYKVLRLNVLSEYMFLLANNDFYIIQINVSTKFATVCTVWFFVYK
jgi:hypothetical protein